jgi:hypothetical protein
VAGTAAEVFPTGRNGGGEFKKPFSYLGKLLNPSRLVPPLPSHQEHENHQISSLNHPNLLSFGE